MSNNIITYKPDNFIEKGYVSIFREIFLELKENRWLTFQLFQRDFFAGYKQSFFGICWTLVTPLMSVGTFIVLNKSGVFSVGEIGMPYPLYAIIGIAFWNLFSSGLASGSDALVRAGNMLTKINFSKKSLVLASFGSSIVSFLIQLILALALFAYYKILPAPGILFLPIVIVPILLLSLGLSFIFALLNSIMRDIGKALPMVLTFLMFLTPVLYGKPKAGILLHITQYNPLYYFVSEARSLVLTGTMTTTEIKGFFFSWLGALGIFIVGLVLFHLTEKRIAERI